MHCPYIKDVLELSVTERLQYITDASLYCTSCSVHSSMHMLSLLSLAPPYCQMHRSNVHINHIPLKEICFLMQAEPWICFREMLCQLPRHCQNETVLKQKSFICRPSSAFRTCSASCHGSSNCHSAEAEIIVLCRPSSAFGTRSASRHAILNTPADALSNGRAQGQAAFQNSPNHTQNRGNGLHTGTVQCKGAMHTKVQMSGLPVPCLICTT